MTNRPLPDSEKVEALLSVTLAVPVEVQQVNGTLQNLAAQAIGVYGTDDGKIEALCLCDLAAASYLGAALSFVPCGVVQQQVKAGRIDENIRDNFKEVMNICVNLFAHPHLPRLTLQQVLTPGEPLPEQVSRAIDAASQRLDVQLQIGRYGTGRMALLCL